MVSIGATAVILERSKITHLPSALCSPSPFLSFFLSFQRFFYTYRQRPESKKDCTSTHLISNLNSTWLTRVLFIGIRCLNNALEALYRWAIFAKTLFLLDDVNFNRHFTFRRGIISATVKTPSRAPSYFSCLSRPCRSHSSHRSGEGRTS